MPNEPANDPRAPEAAREAAVPRAVPRATAPSGAASASQQRPEFRAPRQSRDVAWSRPTDVRAPTREEPTPMALNLDVFAVERAAIRLRRLRVEQADAQARLTQAGRAVESPSADVPVPAELAPQVQAAPRAPSSRSPMQKQEGMAAPLGRDTPPGSAAIDADVPDRLQSFARTGRRSAG